LAYIDQSLSSVSDEKKVFKLLTATLLIICVSVVQAKQSLPRPIIFFAA